MKVFAPYRLPPEGLAKLEWQLETDNGMASVEESLAAELQEKGRAKILISVRIEKPQEFREKADLVPGAALAVEITGMTAGGRWRKTLCDGPPGTSGGEERVEAAWEFEEAEVQGEIRVRVRILLGQNLAGGGVAPTRRGTILWEKVLSAGLGEKELLFPVVIAEIGGAEGSLPWRLDISPDRGRPVEAGLLLVLNRHRKEIWERLERERADGNLREWLLGDLFLDMMHDLAAAEEDDAPMEDPGKPQWRTVAEVQESIARMILEDDHVKPEMVRQRIHELPMLCRMAAARAVR